MAAIVNARDALLQAAATRFVTPPLVGTVDFASQVTGAEKPANNADVTQTAVNSGVTATAGGITLSGGGSIKGGQSDYATGTGVFLGYSGGAYKLSVGSPTEFLRFDGTNLTFSGALSGATGTFSGALSAASGTFTGDITGGANIDITGSAIFDGASSVGGASASTIVNSSANVGGGQVNGLIAYTSNASGTGVQGIAVSSGGIGVYGVSAAGYGMKAAASTGSATALVVQGWSASSPGLNITNGKFSWGASTWAMPSGTGLFCADGTWVAQSTFATAGHNHSGVYQPAGSYASASHDHSGYQANGINIFSLTRNTPDNAAYSTDGGATWVPIQLKFT